jgi:hypothetical protein
VHTVELLLDEALEAGVVALWDRLHAAGLPSLATHRHPTNRPHLTLLTTAFLAGLPALPLPIEAELGAVRMLGRALVRTVPPTGPLEAVRALAGPSPGEWVPHVSLALRVPEELRGAALDLLVDEPPVRGWFVAVRSYDTVTRTLRT